MDTCHLTNANGWQEHQNTKVDLYSEDDSVKDVSGAHAVFTEQGSSASQMTAAKIMDIISRLPGCDGQAADAVSAYTQVKMEDAHKLFKIPNRSVQTFGFVYHDTNGQNHGPVWKTHSFLLNGICTVILWQDYCGKGNLRKSYWHMAGRKFPNRECLFVHREKGLFLSVYVDDIKQSRFRYDASPASTWFQANIVNLATTQWPRGCSSSAKMDAKLFLVLVELARNLVAFFLWASPRRRTPALIDQGNLIEKWMGHFIEVWFSELICWSTVLNSVTANSSLVSPTGSVTTLPPIRKDGYGNSTWKQWLRYMSYENEVNENYSITSKIGPTRTPTSRPESRTPMTTLTSKIAWRTCIESARTAHLFHSCDCLTLHISWSSPERHSESSPFHPWRTLLDSLLHFLLLPLLPVCPRLPLHLELSTELFNTQCMANNLRCSACRNEWGHPERLPLPHT